MRRYELIAPCHFGMEAVLKKEIIELGYDVSEVADGRITFLGDGEALCRANVFLRTAERVLIKIGRFTAETYEELFQGTRRCPGRNIFPGTAGSGSPRPPASRVSFSVLRTSSGS